MGSTKNAQQAPKQNRSHTTQAGKPTTQTSKTNRK